MKAPGLIALAIAVGGLSYFIGKADGKAAAAESVRAQKTKSALQGAATFAVRKRLADEASRKSAPARDSTPRVTAKAGADSLAQRIAALEDSLRGKLAPDPRDEIIFDLHRQADKLTAALAASEKEKSAWREEAVRYRLAADSALVIMQDLSAALTAEAKAHQCRIAFVPCPSRKASLLAGVAIGLTVAVALH